MRKKQNKKMEKEEKTERDICTTVESCDILLRDTTRYSTCYVGKCFLKIVSHIFLMFGLIKNTSQWKCSLWLNNGKQIQKSRKYSSESNEYIIIYSSD